MDKAPDAFRTISEVADDLDVPQHVLRFWETPFSADQADEARRRTPLLPARRYRPAARHPALLYGEGYTIRGVQRILRDQGVKFVQLVWQPGAAQPAIGPVDEAHEQTAPLALDEAARPLFGLLKAPSAAQTASAMALPTPEPILTRENVRRLQNALHELGECRRLIDDALKDEAA